MNKLLSLTFTLVSFFATSAYAFNEVSNGSEIRERVGTSGLASRNLSHLKVAILDNGFRGYLPGTGMLPASAELIEGPLKVPETSAHGLGMAQILWEATGKDARGPKFYLINTNGFTNFKAAVDFVINNNVDIVLYSQIWTFGSNFDGKGFINEAVNRATNAGVIWINAAGNLGGQVYNGNVSESGQKFELRNSVDENAFMLTLTWNDFNESEASCSVKDLNLEFYDAKGTLLKSGSLVQSGVAPDPQDASDKRTCYARETIAVNNLSRGSYYLKVTQKSQNFGGRDSFRVILTENKLGTLEFPGADPRFEIMPPADNANVFTVGEKSAFSAMGPTSDARIKPDVVLENAQVSFTNGSQTAGSSNAAAMVAGAVVILKNAIPEFTGQQLIEYAQSLRTQVLVPAGLVKVPPPPYWLDQLIPVGGTVRQDPGTFRLVILSRENPTRLPQLRGFNLQMRRQNDIVACVENMSTCQVFSADQDYSVKAPWIEFRQYKNGSTADGPGTWIMPAK
ncbi:MAG TPA: S8 family serine peptidase [Bacteriovoracaceae bacterium]|nr:S8 family serine peptidase [Bacteriovoracaceae bacterium]